MGFFNRKKENEVTSHSSDPNARIKVLGAGCDKCDELIRNLEAALKELSIDQEVSHITDFLEIAKHGVMSTPGLVINNKVISIGKVLSIKELKEILEKEDFR